MTERVRVSITEIIMMDCGEGVCECVKRVKKNDRETTLSRK